MKARDLLILTAVLLVGGFAVADAIRPEGTATPRETTQERPTTTSPPITTAPEPLQLGRQKFPDVTGVGGSLVFTNPPSCAVREVDLPTGIESPNVVRASTCELWIAPKTQKIAVGIDETTRDAVPFRFVDLGRTRRNLGNSTALFGFLLWSPDGQRAAWCNSRRVAIDLELGGSKRRLDECPAAYTQDGRIAYARENRLLVEDRVVLRTRGGITNVHFGVQGSVAVVVDGRRIERYLRDGTLHLRRRLPRALEGRLPSFTPNNCAALFELERTIRLLDVGCSSYEDATFPGRETAWSPDTNWIAVAERRTIAFHYLPGGREVVRWDAEAAELAWRGF
jgi:WD40-like Beta Propeller Repeat